MNKSLFRSFTVTLFIMLFTAAVPVFADETLSENMTGEALPENEADDGSLTSEFPDIGRFKTGALPFPEIMKSLCRITTYPFPK